MIFSENRFPLFRIMLASDVLEAAAPTVNRLSIAEGTPGGKE